MGRLFFLFVTSSQKLSPRAGTVAANAISRRKGNDLKLPSAASCSPPQSAYADSSPARGGAFWRSANSYVKPALKGEVDANEMSRRRGCIGAALVYRNPSVNPPHGVLPAPRPGSLLVLLTTSPVHTPLAYFTWRSHISLRISAISPCASRISLRTKVRFTPSPPPPRRYFL